MTSADRWLLPDGVEEILPADAEHIEQIRRSLLNLYNSWGYDLVIPPLLEYTDSLLIGLGRDLDLLTFKVTDQLSGRSMGIRADITPQTARMDAHSFRREGANRLCYAGHVVYTRPRGPLATRTPIQAGVELYGVDGLNADAEVVSLMLESLRVAGLPTMHIDLGHVGIFRALAKAGGLDSAQEEAFFELLQRKASTEIKAWVAANISDTQLASILLKLPAMAGNAAVLEQAKSLFAQISNEALAAVEELQAVAAIISERYPQAKLYFDLSELRGYHYHTGIVFAAFAPGFGNAIANGGRYDSIGEVFGHARPATGFSLDITAVNSLVQRVAPDASGIFVPAELGESGARWQAMQTLREQGERIVCGLHDLSVNSGHRCDRQLTLVNGEYQVQSI
jgi:ATP phosphoribosyltransferase regulatory subunit